MFVPQGILQSQVKSRAVVPCAYFQTFDVGVCVDARKKHMCMIAIMCAEKKAHVL